MSLPRYEERIEDGQDCRMTEEEMRKTLAMLQVEHRDLDIAIAALTESDGPDLLQVARLKKRKLRLKDQISAIADYLTPDIIA
tara:strand:+ start:13398 stop:13646 length:249 start_codon:yes stop_codon:yes gene_type:complete